MRTRIIFLALCTLVLAGCVTDTQFPVTGDGEGIVLNLLLEEPQTKATKDGITALNENVISNTIDVFFYNLSSGVITKEALAVRRNGNQVSIQTNPNDIETIFGTTSSGARCGVFVVANFTGTYDGTPGSRNIGTIKDTFLPAPTWETLPQASFVMTGEQAVTLGNAQGSTPVSATIGLARIAAKVTFDVTVASNAGDNGAWTPDTQNMSVYMVYAMRQASLGAEPVDMPIDKNETIGSSSEKVVYEQYIDKVLYDTGETKVRPRGESTETCAVFSTTHDGDKPFYTYPCAWETGSSMEPYMKLIIPWTYGNTTRKYYYKIPFAGNSLERNYWYHISIDVQILGVEQADPPAVLVYYAVADWSGTMDTATAENITSQTSVPATVITARYLSVPITEYVMYNSDELVIPIQSSHDVEVVGFTVASGAYTSSHDIDANYVGVDPRIYNPFTTTLESTGKIVAAHPDYSQTTPSAVSHSFTYNQAADSDGWSVVVNRRESVTLTHAINRDMTSSNYDVAPYTIRMRFRHQGEGASLYFVDVTVEQRPSIIIKPEANSGGTSNCGYAYVNAGQNNGDNWSYTSSGGWYNTTYSYYSTDGSWTGAYRYYHNRAYQSAYDEWTYYLGSSPSNLSNSSNTNTNMYVIETSVLPTSGPVASYMLGDPRSRDIDNLGQSWSQSKPAVVGSNRMITYYYPAGGAGYEYFIAPKFRIASSFGSTQPMTYDNAKRRCASYQEDGYPAGRWRLPTVAEITYMAQLTTDNLIPRLLGGSDSDDTDYWSNNGYVTVPGGTSSSALSHSTGTTGTKYARCVYDEWYWEDTTYERVTETSFKWGDQERSTVRKN
jgi:hypothetical protein